MSYSNDCRKSLTVPGLLVSVLVFCFLSNIVLYVFWGPTGQLVWRLFGKWPIAKMFQSITRNSIKLRSSQTTLGCNMKKGWAHRYRKCLDSYHVIRCIPHQYEVSLKWRCDPGGPWGLKDNHSPSRSSLHLLLDYWFTSKRVHLHLKQRSLKGAMAHLSLHHSAHPEYLLMCVIRWFLNALFLSFL